MTADVTEKVENLDVNDEEAKDEDIVTPWTVSTSSTSGINYSKLIGQSLFFSITANWGL